LAPGHVDSGGSAGENCRQTHQSKDYVQEAPVVVSLHLLDPKLQARRLFPVGIIFLHDNRVFAVEVGFRSRQGDWDDVFVVRIVLNVVNAIVEVHGSINVNVVVFDRFVGRCR
jgi:hypothetical protein